MCEQSEINYLDGEVVWVKLGSCWWPGEVVGPDKLPPDVLPSFKKPPIAVVKFFQETTYEYVKNINAIYKYNCSRKNEFINKGLYMYRTKHGHMEKFPEDVIRAETAVGGDKEILTRDEFQEEKKKSYAGLFGDKKKTPASGKKGRGRGRSSESPKEQSYTPSRKFYKDKNDYKVHILVQPSKESTSQPTDTTSTPSTSRAGSEVAEDKQEKPQKPEPQTQAVSTPTASTPGTYSCPTCSFTTTRLNVLVLHNKTHSASFTPYTPSPVRKKPTPKSPPKSVNKTPKTPKTSRVRKDKTEKAPKKPTQSKKRAAEDKPHVDAKKAKTDQEIKSSLLADWDDDAEDESNDESTSMLASGSPEVPARSESPAVPTTADLPGGETSRETSSPEKKSDEVSGEKPECSSDSKYEFCEDEDWPVEADGGRKIPRVKNPSKRKDDTKSLSLDEDEVAKEVAELLNKTALPELPSVPEPLKVEENFPEPSVVKSPDKKPNTTLEPNKASEKAIEPKPTIFKTKTFFRSRHSRSQDAIGKYVAEQLNAERIDILESDINGSEAVSSPEARESPPVDHVKVARLAPKIQLKKMKAEAAQLREKEKTASDKLDFGFELWKSENTEFHLDSMNIPPPSKAAQDVIYPTQEIKPINKDSVKALHIDTEHTTMGKSTTNAQDQNEKQCVLPNSDMNIEIENRILDKTIESSSEFYNEVLDCPNIQLGVSQNSPKLASPVNNKAKTYGKHMKSPQKTEISTLETSPQKSQESMPVLPSNNNSPKSSISESNSLSPNTSLIVHTPKKSPLKLAETLPSPVKTTSNLQKTYEQLIEPYMTESTASAVDALLSVSRETDRVPRIVGSGPPEDLFEDDHKDIVNNEEEIPENAIEDKLKNDSNKETSEELKSEQNGIIEEPAGNENTPMDIDVTVPDNSVNNFEKQESVSENAPSESDLQIAETLINLPSTAIQNAPNEQLENVEIPMAVDSQQIEEIITESVVESEVIENTSKDMTPDLLVDNNKNHGIRFETEQEKSENLNAAQSLVEMSESMDHKMNILENKPINNDVVKSSLITNQNNGLDTAKSPDQKNDISKDNKIEPISKISQFDSSSSKLLKILEEPTPPKPPSSKTTPVKQLVSTKKVIVTGKEKILNFDVASSALINKPQVPKQKIIIRRTGSGKSFINSLSDVVSSPDKIILSRTNVAAQDGSSVQTFTIQASPDVTTASDAKQIIIQPKFRKVAKPPPTTKVQKIKPQNSLVQWSDTKMSTEASLQEEPMFDINSMPVVLSDDILTPESIEKMPFVMSDGNIITNTPPPQNPPKLIKTSKPTIVENEKVQISASPGKPEMKTLLMNVTSDVNKVTTTPNILSKSAKLRGAKPMLVIDKTTGKQKIIMTKGDSPAVKEIKPAQTLIQPVATQTVPKTEKFIILPSGGSPRSGRTQKIVIDPQTGKAHVLVTKGQETQISAQENKPVSAKLIPSSSDAGSPGNTVMIITNAQGGQSRIVLTPEHEKILFPNKQQPNVSQLKTITHRITPATVAQKTIVAPASPVKTPAKIVPKQQKGAIITSKGQLIVGGRVATTAQNIAPLPEIRPAPKTELRAIPKRVAASEPKKLVQAIQKNSSEPLILLQQKSGAVMQLTAAQFEHLQRTGQIIQKTPVENKIVVQKSITISPKDTTPAVVQKQQRVRKAAAASPTPTKKLKQQPMLAPAPAPSIAPMPPLTSLSHSVSTVTPSLPSIVPSVSETVSITTSGGYPELENFEELLPTSSIIRHQPEHTIVTSISQPDPPIVQPEPIAEPPPAQLSDGQLLAVPGENFGGPPGSFYLCVEDNGTLTPIDNRPLVLENNQLVPMAIETLPVFAPQPERRDILEAALANSDVFHADVARDDAPDFRDLNANVSVHCRVSETSTTLNQPIMTPVEVPTKADSEPAVPSNLEDGLAVIGVTPHTVPTSLELPITVTDPRIAPKMTDPLSNSNYGTTLLASPNTDMTFVSSEQTETGAAISMPLLADEEAVGKSMPILTDDALSGERTESSSLESLETRDRDADEAWVVRRRLLTPATDHSDASETSAEIPLQPHLQLSVDDLQRAS